jgi:hypothetical protein
VGKPPTSCSKACATFRQVVSSNRRPTSIIPTGSPWDSPAGTLVAGCPLTSNGAVLTIISSARATWTSSGSSGAGSGGATIGTVGITSRSTSASARSYCARTSTTRLRAIA